MSSVEIAPPVDLTEVADCADWLELVALVADDGNASAGDLERVLRRSATFGKSDDESLAIEEFCGQVFTELSYRARIVDYAYPFELTPTALQKRKTYISAYAGYLFCLCLSYYRKAHPKLEGVNPRLLFETISSAALSGYLSTEDCQVFGTGRLKSAGKEAVFIKAVNDLALLIGEGNGFKPQKTLSKKDDHLDVVAVKHFPDKLSGKLIFFGQCATGDDWKSKVSEMNPVGFCGMWLQDTVASTINRSFFMPFILDREEKWRYQSFYAGVMFERMRVAHYAPKSSVFVPAIASMNSWIRACLNSKYVPKKRVPAKRAVKP
jgi:hypothetical protein